MVLKKFLAGNEEPYFSLSKQIDKAIVTSRIFTGWGFFTDYAVPDSLAVRNLHGYIIDVMALSNDSDKIYGFRLLVEDGKTDSLEGYCFIDGWDIEFDKVELEYLSDKRIHRFHE